MSEAAAAAAAASNIVSTSDWIKGISLSVLASMVGGASKLAIRKSWLIQQQQQQQQQQPPPYPFSDPPRNEEEERGGLRPAHEIEPATIVDRITGLSCLEAKSADAQAEEPSKDDDDDDANAIHYGENPPRNKTDQLAGTDPRSSSSSSNNNNKKQIEPSPSTNQQQQQLLNQRLRRRPLSRNNSGLVFDHPAGAGAASSSSYMLVESGDESSPARRPSPLSLSNSQHSTTVTFRHSASVPMVPSLSPRQSNSGWWCCWSGPSGWLSSVYSCCCCYGCCCCHPTSNCLAYTLRGSGMIGMTVLNPLCSVLAMRYASPSILAPFSGLTLVWIVLLSHRLIGEAPTLTQVIAAMLIVLGEVVVAVYGDHYNDAVTVEQVRQSYLEVTFLCYFGFMILWMLLLFYWMYHPATAPKLKRFSWGVAGGSITGLQNFLKDSLSLLQAVTTSNTNGSSSLELEPEKTHEHLPWFFALLISMAVFSAFGGLLLLTACMKRYDVTFSAAMFVGSFVVSATIMSAIHYDTFQHLQTGVNYLMYPTGLGLLMVGVFILVQDSKAGADGCMIDSMNDDDDNSDGGREIANGHSSRFLSSSSLTTPNAVEDIVLTHSQPPSRVVTREQSLVPLHQSSKDEQVEAGSPSGLAKELPVEDSNNDVLLII